MIKLNCPVDEGCKVSKSFEIHYIAVAWNTQQSRYPRRTQTGSLFHLWPNKKPIDPVNNELPNSARSRIYKINLRNHTCRWTADSLQVALLITLIATATSASPSHNASLLPTTTRYAQFSTRPPTTATHGPWAEAQA